MIYTKQFVRVAIVAGTFLVLGAALAYAQIPAGHDKDHGPDSLVIPDSSVEQHGDAGNRAHTNHVILLRSGSIASAPSGETPASLGCVYQIVSSQTPGCPKSSTIPPAGGSGTIAIVDAYDYPTAANDFNVFSSQFHLPTCPTDNSGCFKVFASGRKPKTNGGWAQEAALDIEWAHAMAPYANIVLVEAASNSFSDLFKAVDVASNIVGGRGEVSMSWGGSEFSSETNSDSHFTTPGVVYAAASGDTGGKTIYPGVSVNVVSAGGTSVNRDASGLFVNESGWSGSGGGKSAYELRPSYQNIIQAIVGSQRGVPDFSYDANPSTGVSVYDSTSYQGLSGWMVFGGTSVAAPSLSGIINAAATAAGAFSASSGNELATIYGNLGTSNFRDITSGTAGSFSALVGWDFVTGVGSNLGLFGK